jgi:hypothetical protein
MTDINDWEMVAHINYGKESQKLWKTNYNGKTLHMETLTKYHETKCQETMHTNVAKQIVMYYFKDSDKEYNTLQECIEKEG